MSKVIHVITTIQRGGAENQLAVLTNEQIKNGFEIVVIPLKGETELDDEFTKQGCYVDLSIINRHPLVQLLELWRKFPNSGLIVHAHLPRAELISAIIRKNNVFVFTRHNTEPFFPNNPRLISRNLGRFVHFRSAGGIAISSAVRDFSIRNREVLLRKRYEVIFYGVSADFQMIDRPLREELNIGDEIFLIGTIARITKQKDFPTLIAAFAEFRKQNLNTKLLIVGDGELKFAMRKLAQELSIDSNIIWYGRTANTTKIYEAIDLFVLTSQYEGFGLVLLEAMSQKVPVVAANNSAIPEVLGSGHPGLFKTGNIELLARKFGQFEKKEIRESTVNHQLKRLALFDPTLMSQKIALFYENI
jgi:glycosyltransferase involved in cell wall biosynthesis